MLHDSLELIGFVGVRVTQEYVKAEALLCNDFTAAVQTTKHPNFPQTWAEFFSFKVN